jgi:hypothetical protein
MSGLFDLVLFGLNEPMVRLQGPYPCTSI